MKLVTSFAIAALIAAPTVAMAQKSTTTIPNGPGQSEFAPGQRAQQPGGKAAKTYAPGQRQTTPGTAKNFAPGQQMHTKNVRGGTTTRH